MPTAEVAQGVWGVSPDQLAKGTGDIYPDVWPAFQIFSEMRGQWRAGFSGFYAMDYTALKWLFELHGIEDAKECYQDIRVMEGVAQDELALAREQK